MAIKKTGKDQRRTQAIFRIIIMALILVCINILASYFHSGLDLTKEKRFTLSPSTKKLLGNLPETAVITVYLDGKLPADLQRMREAVREKLASFKSVAGNKVIFNFVDPIKDKPDNEQKQIVRDLHDKGIEYLPLKVNEDEGYSMKICFPYALLQYNGREMPIPLLEYNPDKNREEEVVVHASALLEYKFASAINQLSKSSGARIAYMVGHKEDTSVHSVDMLTTLASLYALDTVDLTRLIHISNAYDAIIFNQPQVPFSDVEKLKIDQYLMRGGHILFAVNAMNASMDSFKKAEKFMSLELGLNLDDMLFKYGIRINNDLVEDKECLQIPLLNATGQMEKHDWIYFPKINPTAENPIVKNMDFIMGGFTNSIDTILTSGIYKTILLETSKYSRVAGTPVTVSLTQAFYPGTNEYFNKPYRPVAVLSEGLFHSVFQNRLAPRYMQLLDSLHEPFIPVAKNKTSIIVTSIGDVFKNDYSAKDGIYRLGYDKYTGDFFANRNFLLNCLEYLTDRSGILEARSKDAKVRLLDVGRAKDEKDVWQWINIGVPLAMVIVFASGYLFFRKRKYEVKKNAKPTVKNA